MMDFVSRLISIFYYSDFLLMWHRDRYRLTLRKNDMAKLLAIADYITKIGIKLL